jgi:hypothetical protein
MERVLSISQPRIASRRDGLVTSRPALERLVGGVLGCWHRRMSWPITRDGQTYRVCAKCGICRSFDPKAWKSFGPFYYRD